MDSMASLFIRRAETEIVMAEKLKEMSEDIKVKEFMQIPQEMTFYSAVISHSYYSIFYSAKAILLTKGIKTYSPDIHKKTLDAFQHHFVDTGILDVKLWEIYKKLVVRADELLGIFKEEKRKRGDFTYNTIPQANQEPAENSVKNAKIFLSNIKKVAETTK
ncbi:HEPN domain-containing protein [Candidatus Woesearchaeota archaeon]|nr:HEPN domain-containing protein [Candidatus Woesearchaeota archaeon]